MFYIDLFLFSLYNNSEIILFLFSLLLYSENKNEVPKYNNRRKFCILFRIKT